MKVLNDYTILVIIFGTPKHRDLLIVWSIGGCYWSVVNEVIHNEPRGVFDKPCD